MSKKTESKPKPELTNCLIMKSQVELTTLGAGKFHCPACGWEMTGLDGNHTRVA